MTERTPRRVTPDATVGAPVMDAFKQTDPIFDALFKRIGSAEGSLTGLTTASEVTGAKGGNAALTSLISVLVAKGIITDSTT